MNESPRVRDAVTATAGRARDNDDLARAYGWVVAEWSHADGTVFHRSEQPNLITSVGDQLYASRGAALTTSALPTGMRLGTGSTAVAKSGAGAAIVTYLATSNKAFDATYPQCTAGVATYKRTYAAGEATSAGTNITEVVINTDTIANDNATTATVANTISRALLASPAPKAAGDTLTITWTHTILGA
jgi:hypothetical protein